MYNNGRFCALVCTETETIIRKKKAGDEFESLKVSNPWKPVVRSSSFYRVVADNRMPSGPWPPCFSHSLPPCREISRRSRRSACLHQKLINSAYLESYGRCPRRDEDVIWCDRSWASAPRERRLPTRRTVDEQRGTWTTSPRHPPSAEKPATDCATNFIESAGNKTSLADRERSVWRTVSRCAI